MARSKKKTLPKDFAEKLERGDLSELKAVFDACETDARGGSSKQTALAFDRCPDDLARWLVAQGADLSATDSYGNTPLHSRSRSRRSGIDVLLKLGADIDSATASLGTPLHAAAASHNVENARLLLERGARADVANKDGLVPLELALQRCSNIDLEHMAPLARALLDAGSPKTARMAAFVTEIGTRFEFHRSGFNRESVDAASDALDQLYALFSVSPVPRRILHDGKTPIVVEPGAWPDQHQALWELLVPSSGPAATVQGEVIRLSGRIARELDGNGGINWDDDFRRMADACLAHLGSGNPVPDADLSEAARLVAEIKRKRGDPQRVAELAVAWVLRNPIPIALQPPAYRR